MDKCGQADQSIKNAMRGHHDSMQVGIFRNPLQFGEAADIFRVRTDDAHGVPLNEILEILPQIYLFAGVNRSGCRLCHFTIIIRESVRCVIACEQIFHPHDVERFKGACDADCIRHHPAGTAIECQTNFIAEHGLHRFHTGDDMLHAFFGQQAAVGMRRIEHGKHIPLRLKIWVALRRNSTRFIIRKVWDLIRHGAMKTDWRLNDGESFCRRFHLAHVFSVIFRVVTFHREAHAAIVHTYFVADLASE